MERGMEQQLQLLGIEIAEDKISRLMVVLRTLLRVQLKDPEPLTFSDIFDAVNSTEDHSSYSKAWIHRLLKELVDKGLVRILTDSPGRKLYVCDINTLRNGLEKIREEQIEELSIQLEEIQTSIEDLNALKPNMLANQLFGKMTGEFDTPTSRFLSGMDEFHRVTEETIYSAVKEGDIIRSSVIDVGSFVNGAENRIGRILTTPSLGAEVRYKVSSEAFNLDSETAGVIPRDWIIDFFRSILQMQGKGLDFRIAKPNVREYQFVSLNNEVMALMISHNPVTAAWVTRKFNSNLIDNVIESFDKEWGEAISLHKLKPEHLSAMGVESNTYVTSIFERAIDSIEPPESGSK